MSSSETVTARIYIDVEPKNLGLFIGKKGSNFKKIILDFKKTALKKTEITPEEWSSLELLLKFEKTGETTTAVFTCPKKYGPLVVKTLKKFVEIHKKEIGEYQKKSHIKKMVFRVGAAHRLIPRMIGVGGEVVNQLKKTLLELPHMESLKSVVIEEQTGYITGHFTNMGEKSSTENILITLVFSGRPDFEVIRSILKDFVEYTTEETKDKSGSEDDWGAERPDDFWKEADEWSSPSPKSEPEPEPEPGVSKSKDASDTDWEENIDDWLRERNHGETHETKPSRPTGARFDEAKAKADAKATSEAEKIKEQAKAQAEAKAKAKAEAKAKAKAKAKANSGTKIKATTNVFDILGIPRNSNLETIKKAYRKLAKEHHPDKGGDEEVFKKISGAFEFLSQKPTAEQE